MSERVFRGFKIENSALRRSIYAFATVGGVTFGGILVALGVKAVTSGGDSRDGDSDFVNVSVATITAPEQRLLVIPSATATEEPTATVTATPILPTATTVPIIVVVAPTNTPVRQVESGPSEFLDTRMASRLKELVNQERVKYGLRPLVSNVFLDKAAGNFATLITSSPSLYRRTGAAAHVSPDGTGIRERLIAAGYFPPDPTPDGRHVTPPRSAGENGVTTFGPSSNAFSQTAEDLVNGWMTSPYGHRENMLNPLWTEFGIGCSVRQVNEPEGKFINFCIMDLATK